MKKILAVFALFVFLSGCAMFGAGMLPETDIGKANYFDGGLRGTVEQYNQEANIATSPGYIETLKVKRTAILNAVGPIRAISVAAHDGTPITLSMINEANIALAMIKDNLLYRARVEPSEAQIATMFEQAGIHNFGPEPKSAKNPWIIAIELAQAMLAFYQQASHQATLTPEQLAAEFAINHQWIMDFTPEQLIQVAS